MAIQIDVTTADGKLEVRRGGPSFKEFDVTGVEQVMVRLGPYDNSDYYLLKYLPDTDEVAVIYNEEILHSTLMEQP